MDFLVERFELAQSRISELVDSEETCIGKPETEYFREAFSFAKKLCDIWHIVSEDAIYDASMEDLLGINRSLYEDIFPDKYENSFNNPTVSVGLFGLEMGRLLSGIMAELRGAIPAIYERDMEALVIRLELILQVYTSFVCAKEDEICVEPDSLRELLRSYYCDYLEDNTMKKIRTQSVTSANPILSRLLAFDDINGNNETDVEKGIKDILLSGEYISPNEIEMYRFLCSIPSNELKAMADTYTSGYIKGFEVTGRDISIKETVELRFNLGFVPMMRHASVNFAKRNLKCTMMRAGYSLFTGRSVDKNGVFGGNPNPQFDFDHKSDLSLLMNKELMEYRLECLENCYEQMKAEARAIAGPAVVDIFGEEPFEPVIKPEAADYSDETRPLVTEYMSRAGQLINKYIPGDERSFTIIAFPVPSIGERFEEIFRDTIKINTLDYTLYRDIQQKIIDALDTAEYVVIKGQNDNHTDLQVHLHNLENPEKQTNFENCVADVNIPVGEVFTSPLLEGTKGVLHVTKVFLNGLEYRNLRLDIKDGKICEYNCDNGKKLIEDNILYHHQTLPMGECAIGTNTTAYEVGRRYGIEAQLPILIAEKTGPHFAFGDTCYSHCEDLAVFNPDGKEIIARDNECSLLRDSEPGKEYFNCHTDITIPYDELGELSALRSDGSKLKIIEAGRFVLDGCEELNKPLDICN